MSVTVEHDGFSVDSNQTAAEALISIGGGQQPEPSPQGDGDGGAPDATEDAAADTTVAETAETTEKEPVSADTEQKPTSRPWKLLHQTEKQLKEAQKQARDYQARLEALEKAAHGVAIDYTERPAAAPATPRVQSPEPQTPAARADASVPVRPKLSEYGSWDEYETAAATYEAQRDAYMERKFHTEFETRQQRDVEQAKARQFEETVAAQLNTVDGKGRTAYSDWQSTLDTAKEAGPWDPRVTVAIANHPDAHHLAYALMKDPEEARRLAGIQHPVSFGVEVGQFIARVVAASSSGSATPARQTLAHAPITPVGSSVGKVDAAPDDLEFGPEYVRRMNARDAARSRR